VSHGADLSFADLVPGSAYSDVSKCALVLEDDPVGPDSRLNFESFPAEGIEESYAVTGYREIAADRMPQPGFAAYRGGNWSAFTLELKFRAGDHLGRTVDLKALSVADLEGILTTMEAKARWCQALCFPLRRKIGEAYTQRIFGRASTGGGISESDLQAVGLGQLERVDPPYVLVQFGSWLSIRCYATGYSLKWEHPFHPDTVQPYGCTVSLSLQRLDLDYPTWESIRGQAGGLPQSPSPRRIQGTSIVSNTAAQIRAANQRAQNAAAFAAGRIGAEPPEFFFSVGGS
jgi:hypothetical protein